MWNKLYFQLHLAVVLSSLLNCIHCQGRGLPEASKSFKCVTHNVETWICSWDGLSNTNSKTVYKVCLGSPEQCFFKEENSIEIEALIFGKVKVRITATNEFGTSEETFWLLEDDVVLLPDTPEILTLTHNFEPSTLFVEWRMNFTDLVIGSHITWAIQILQNENVLSTELYNTTWSGRERIIHWNWTSDLPLECADHSVRIRCYIDAKHFKGHKDWSEWSLVKTVPGSHPSLYELAVFPGDKVVPVGSNLTFCCVAKEVHSTSFRYGKINYTTIPLSNYSRAIHVNNVSMSEASGTNAFCTLPGVSIVGSVIFVGYPPDTPQDFDCETHDLKKIVCSWNPGRPTGLYGERKTKYILYERNSGLNATCDDPKLTNEKYKCFFDIINNQSLYNLILRASNPLNSSETSASINVTQRVHLEAPNRVEVYGSTSRSIQLSWFLSGKLAHLRLLCQIKIYVANKEMEPQRDVYLDGADDSHYSSSVNRLHPFTVYAFSVRCSVLENFWKWSEWSHEKEHQTSAAPPSGRLSVWRENMRNSEERKLIIYWKPLSSYEANGLVHSHVVSWKVSDENSQFKNISVPSPYNKTQITLDNDDKAYIINVVANNSVGLSPSATIKSDELPNDVKVEKLVGNKDGINITWDSDADVNCGYIVQWRSSFGYRLSDLQWETFSSDRTSVLLASGLFQDGVQYNFSLYACKDDKYQLLKNLAGYMIELAPKVAPNATVEQTTSNSIQIKWDDIPAEDLQGFLQGYLVYLTKQENDTSKSSSPDLRNSNVKVRNITNTSIKDLTIVDLQGSTSYRVELQAYTGGGKSPLKSLYVFTNDNSIGLILAILIPIVVATLFAVVTSTVCYRKREWIKETFYPDIPNPENSKALQFQKSISQENAAVKTLEMNPCTPNSVEVVENLSTVPKVMDTDLMSPIGESEDLGTHVPEYNSDMESENHVVISYCPPIMDEEVSNPTTDEAVGSSKVVYLNIQSIYQPQAKSEEETENEFVDKAGYKPQMQLSINTVKADNHITTEDELEQCAGYRPQANVNTWNVESPCSASSTDTNSENASFGSPCSINSRHFLIPPEEDQDTLKPTHVGWSFTSLFHSKSDD
ncbi:leukemia inhibitory factor receptor isoform X3 [Microcaecilia unicolor]|uniref:Leukemia inhibitory factor receptor isoform X3 n=1 Tax=Microcaecilia unicolor TaxID=1415580 RepID=A0A6P7X056_9AMPH|nr:leukemia inhibitory factor receptor isoform X3 [Microcaecilia unicolor]